MSKKYPDKSGLLKGQSQNVRRLAAAPVTQKIFSKAGQASSHAESLHFQFFSIRNIHVEYLPPAGRNSQRDNNKKARRTYGGLICYCTRPYSFYFFGTVSRA
jgi:hypothetical protein